MKILIAGDNHGNIDIINELNYVYKDIQIKLHTGDSTFENSDIDALKNWVKVEGNMDVLSLGKQEVIEVGNDKIFLTHGHYFYATPNSKQERLVNEAKNNNCNILVYGHTHHLDIRFEDDLLIINPNSIENPFVPNEKTYVVLTIEQNSYKVELMNLKHEVINTYEW